MKNVQFTTQIIDQIPNNLPEGVTLEQFKLDSRGNMGVDGTAVLKAGNQVFPIAFEVKNTGGTAIFREAAREIKTYGEESGSVPFVVGSFFGERSRQVAKEEGVGLIDLAGNFYLKQDNMYVERIVDKNPFTQKLPLKNLFAPVSSRISRVLLSNPQKEWILQTLSQEADMSLGQTYKVIERMIEEEFVVRNNKNKLVLKDPSKLVEAWKQVYPTYNQQKITLFSYERDYAAVLDSILELGQRENMPYALGFFTGADVIAPFIRGLSKVQVYIPTLEDIGKWKTVLNLQDTQRGGNVEFYIPYDQGIFYKTQQIKSTIAGDVPVVSNVQLYMDLFNNPARGEEAAQHLREVKLQY